MRYRVTYTDPDDTTTERPAQYFTNDWQGIKQWAEKALERGGPRGYVAIYETKEVLVETANRTNGVNAG